MAERYDFYVHDNRKITFNLTEPIMREDSGVTDFVFHIPKILNELEVSDWQWWLVFVNAKKEKYSIALTLSDDPERPLEYNLATYTVDYAMSIKAGSVQFALEAINTGTGGAIDNEWHTLTYETKVKETLQGNQAEYAETESDIISALLIEVRNKVNQLVGGATPTPVSSVSAMTDPSKLYLLTTDGEWYYYNGSAWVSGGVYGAGIVDSVPTQGSTNAVSSGGVYSALQDKADRTDIDDLNDSIDELDSKIASLSSVPTAVRNAIYTLLTKAVYTETGLTDEIAVVESWASAVTSITLNHTSATVTSALQLSAVTVPAGGVITWSSSNSGVATVDSNGLVTGVTNGTAYIIATSGDATARCKVDVVGFATLTGITATYMQSGTVYNTATLDDLKPDLVVTANYDDGSSVTLASRSYTLSGTLAVGTSTITVGYGGFTATFTVNVTRYTRYTEKTKLIATGNEYAVTDLSEVDLDGCSFEYKVAPTADTTGGGHILSTQNNYLVFPQNSSIKIFRAKIRGTETAGRTSTPWTNGELYTVIAYADEVKSVTANGTTVVTSTTVGTVEPSASNMYYLFSYGGGEAQRYRFTGDFYYLKVFSSDSTLIHHLVPATDNETGINGVLDIVTETFYTSATSTAFTVE